MNELREKITVVLNAVVLRAIMENKALPEHISAMTDEIMKLIKAEIQKNDEAERL